MVAVTFLLDSNPFQSLLPEASLLLVLRGMCPEGQLAVPLYLKSEDSEMTPGPSGAGGWQHCVLSPGVLLFTPARVAWHF